MSLTQALHRTKKAYAGDAERPLGSYTALMAAYGGLVGSLGLVVKATGRTLPERVDAADLALMAVATHKLARLVAHDPVTSPLRAPFTQYDGVAGDAELAEQTRGTGPQHAVGELLTCPFCLGQWVATGFAFGLVLAPRPTRLAMSVFTALTAADFLQYAYAAVQPDQD